MSWRFQIAAVAVIIVIAGLLATWGAGCNRYDAAEQVNQGCVSHGGVRSWGGDDAYSATCEDGFAFEGNAPPTWEWPW